MEDLNSQYYTFNTIGEITFGKKLGFLEQGKDVDHTMKAIDLTLTYNAIIGQVPLAHKFLLSIPGLAYIILVIPHSRPLL